MSTSTIQMYSPLPGKYELITAFRLNKSSPEFEPQRRNTRTLLPLVDLSDSQNQQAHTWHASWLCPASADGLSSHRLVTEGARKHSTVYSRQLRSKVGGKPAVFQNSP